MSKEQQAKDQGSAAIIASLAIAGGFVVYWIVQIQSVRELLALAYG